MPNKIRVTVWGENVHEKDMPVVAAIYPKGMHECIADGIREDPDFEVRTATLDMPEHGHPSPKAPAAEPSVMIATASFLTINLLITEFRWVEGAKPQRRVI